MDRRIVVTGVAVASFALGWFIRPLVWPRRDTTDVAARKPVGPTTETTTSRQSAFGDIYKNATWGKNADDAGNSGFGSTAENTLLYRAFLEQFLRNNKIKSVVDAGCGDWEFSHLIDWTGIDYKGFDIVPAVIEQDTQKYGKPNIQFFVGDMIEQDLPEADLLIVKHVLQHLSNADVQKFLARQPKRFKHVLLINGVDPDTLSSDNPDIKAGEYRDIDLTKPPFNVAGVKVFVYRDPANTHQVIYIAGKR